MESLKYNLSNMHLSKGWGVHDRCGREDLATCQRIYRFMFKLTVDLMKTTARGDISLSVLKFEEDPNLELGNIDPVAKFLSVFLPEHKVETTA